MRALLLLLVAVAVSAVAGCAGKKAAAPPGGVPGALTPAQASVSRANPNVVVTRDTTLTGKVVRVNPTARIVVLNFPIGHLPTQDQHMDLYRGGLKVGQVRVSGWQLEDSVVADVLAGEAQIGDEVRAQ
jgi:hypothetical protein